uniref:Uncharacterized protein n=1 Tax=Anopheles atroparvus TaxID=41427 RepID=A0A182JB47_ANOAO
MRLSVALAGSIGVHVNKPVIILREAILSVFHHITSGRRKLMHGIHFRLLDAVPVGAREPLPAEVHRDRVDARIGRPGALDHLVHRYVRLPAVHRAERKAALLQLRFRIVPVLVHDEVLQPREQTHVAERFAVLQLLVDVQRTEERLEQIGPILGLQVRLRVRVDSVLRHPEIVTDDRLRAIVDQRAAQQRQVALVVLREVPVEVLRADQLQHRVAQELQPLVGAERQVREANRAIGERSRQQPNVVKAHPDRFLEARQRFQHLERLDVMPIAERFLFLQRMPRIVHPDAAQRVVLLEERVGKDAVGHLDATVEQEGPHQRLEAVCQRVPFFASTAKCWFCTIAARYVASPPSSRSGNMWNRWMEVINSTTASPRNSSRSLCVMLLSVSCSFPNRDMMLMSVLIPRLRVFM